MCRWKVRTSLSIIATRFGQARSRNERRFLGGKAPFARTGGAAEMKLGRFSKACFASRMKSPCELVRSLAALVLIGGGFGMVSASAANVVAIGDSLTAEYESLSDAQLNFLSNS